MLEILQYCHAAGCSIHFDFDIPSQISITLINMEKKEKDPEDITSQITQCLPWDHIYDEKVLDLVNYCVKQIRS